MIGLSYSALMPPLCLLVATPVGVIIAFWWRRTGLAIALISSLLLYACCTRFVSERLLTLIEDQVPLATANTLSDAQAIVVLSGDVYYGKRGIAPDDVGPSTLERLRLAAALHRAHPLPVLVTGGMDDRSNETSAALMAHALEQDYGIKPRWIEDKSRNTFENGTYSATILKANGITRVIIVTDAWHLPRALWSFAHAGLTAIPAPAERIYLRSRFNPRDFTPDYASFANSFYALHELFGLASYRVVYGPVVHFD